MELAFSKPTSPTVVGEYYPATITIDGREVRLRIARFTLDQFTTFSRDFNRVGRIVKRDEVLLDRHRQKVIDRETGEPLKEWLDEPETDEQGRVQRDADGTVRLRRVQRIVFEDDATVLARLELDETDEQRAAREQRERDDNQFAADFLVQAITDYIAVEPGQLSTDTSPITTGAQLLAKYAGRQDVTGRLLQTVYLENCIDDATKKKLQSRRATAATSIAAETTAAGSAPAPIAASASEMDSAPAVIATA